MGTLGEVKRGRLDNGGTLEDAVLILFDGDSCDDCPLPISFKDLSAVDFILGSLGCDGSVVTVFRSTWKTKNKTMESPPILFV